MHTVIVIYLCLLDVAEDVCIQTTVSVLNDNCFQIQEGLSPNHLKKAKLMFFYTRYPSSNMLKMFFSDVKVSPNMLLIFIPTFALQTFQIVNLFLWTGVTITLSALVY